MADYSSQNSLRGFAAFTPEEEAQIQARERSPENLAELDQAIQQERNPANRRILMEARQSLAGDAPAPRAAAAVSGGLLDRLQSMDGGAPVRARMGLFDALQQVPDAVAPPPPSSAFRRMVFDTGVSALKSAVSVPEMAVGLADLATGGEAGRVLENKDGVIGFRPKETQAILDTWYSPEQQAANRAVQQADGVWDTVKAVASNPSTIYHSAVQSLPMMLGGGITGRALMAGAARAGVAMSPVLAGAVGEGVVSAGSQAEQIRQETPDGRLTTQQVALAAGSGFADTAIGLLSGRLAKRLGIHDIDTLIAGKAAPEVTKGFLRRVLEGALSEGLLEELPQSVQEQVAQNLALGKPIGEGVAQNAVLGALTGGAMGGAANFRGHAKQPADQVREQKVADPQGPAAKAVNAGLEAQAQQVESAAPTEPVMAAPAEEGAPGATVADPFATQTPPAPVTGNVPAEAVSVPAVAETPAPVSPADGIDPLDRMHQQAAADAQSLRDFSPEPTPEREPAKVVVADDSRPQPLEGDVLNPQGDPFRNRAAANRRLRELGDGYVLASVDGGYVLRPLGSQVKVEQPDLSAPAQAVEQHQQRIDETKQAVREVQAEQQLQPFSPETGTLGVPRAEMPQIKTEHHGPLVNFLNARGITHEQVEVDPRTLKPTQAEFDPEKVRSLAGGDTDARNILVSSDGHVLDGHHRWLARLHDGAESVKAIRLDAPMKELLPVAREFPSAQVADDQPQSAPAPTDDDMAALRQKWPGLADKPDEHVRAAEAWDKAQRRVRSMYDFKPVGDERINAIEAEVVDERGGQQGVAADQVGYLHALTERLETEAKREDTTGTLEHARRNRRDDERRAEVAAHMDRALGEEIDLSAKQLGELAGQGRLNTDDIALIESAGDKFGTAQAMDEVVRSKQVQGQETTVEPTEAANDALAEPVPEPARARRKRLAAQRASSQEQPEPAAPAQESAAATSEGANHGEGQEGWRQARLLTPEAPAAESRAPAPAPAATRPKRQKAQREAAAAPAQAASPATAEPKPQTPTREQIELRKRLSILNSLKACLAS